VAFDPAEATGDLDCIPRDSIDRLLEAWHAVSPSLDFAPVGIVTRMERVRGHVRSELERLFAEHGLTAPAFGVLVTLARLNQAGGVSQRQLMDELGLSSGTVSVRMDRLQEIGLIDRRPDRQDKRNTRVTLTVEGRALFERIVPDHLDNERRLLAALSEPECELLAALLRKLLVEFEGSVAPADAPFGLGLTVAPAHVTIAMRRAVGLSAEPGLLVRRVEEDAPAGRAGLVAGDVIVAAPGREIRSIASLYAAIGDAAAGGRLHLTILRGAATQPATIRLVAGSWTMPAAAARGRGVCDEHAL
jgi:DNA-binding MarR family transcriptional regulator